MPACAFPGQVIGTIKKAHADVPVALYANGSRGVLNSAPLELVNVSFTDRSLPPSRRRTQTSQLSCTPTAAGASWSAWPLQGLMSFGLDWSVDMADGRRRVGEKAVQGNVDPAVLSRPAGHHRRH